MLSNSLHTSRLRRRFLMREGHTSQLRLSLSTLAFCTKELSPKTFPSRTQTVSAPPELMEFPVADVPQEAQEELREATGEQPMAIDTVQTGEQQLPGTEHHISALPADAQEGGPAVDPTVDGAVQHVDHAALIGAPPGLPTLHQTPPSEPGSGEEGSGSKFRPIDLEQLSPKSRQRVLRNRQAATRSKAKKKQQFQELKDRKTALAMELEQLEAQHAAIQQRVAHLHVENKGLMDSCKCADKVDG